jgi:hypothetical protein
MVKLPAVTTLLDGYRAACFAVSTRVECNRTRATLWDITQADWCKVFAVHSFDGIAFHICDCKNWLTVNHRSGKHVSTGTAIANSEAISGKRAHRFVVTVYRWRFNLWTTSFGTEFEVRVSSPCIALIIFT